MHTIISILVFVLKVHVFVLNCYKVLFTANKFTVIFSKDYQ